MESESELTYYMILIAGTSGMLLLTIAIILFVYLYQRKLIKRKLAYQKIEDLLQKQELNSAYAILQAQDKERKRIAQDLHDNLGSILVTLNMYADILVQKQTAEEKNDLADKISKLALQANEETRNVSHSLDSGTLQHFGLKTALIDLVDAIKEAKSIEVNLEIELHKIENGAISLNLYRIIQELFNNTLKHANASIITIELTQSKENHLSLIYEDNGIGFNLNEVMKKGMGLTNLKTRVENMNGELTIDAVMGKGATFIIELERI